MSVLVPKPGGKFGFLVAALVGVGPLAVLIALLNRRDKRAAALLSIVGRHLPSPVLRSDVAVETRASVLGAGGVVRIAMGRVLPEEVWGALSRLREVLPSPIRLVVEGHMPPAGAIRRSTRLMVELVGERPGDSGRAAAAALRRAA
jgi:hypothetical protein